MAREDTVSFRTLQRGNAVLDAPRPILGMRRSAVEKPGNQATRVQSEPATTLIGPTPKARMLRCCPPSA
ncbi:DUF1534 domain-containing protein [Pseudomonas syringae]|uniref:DUF1534 domain-containing protein n=1 Tax=Pseudomonas syringae TaxID=317 RepID=A0A9Q4A6R5_PSESX|nr:DUF1534 domain-containing protein [Pseudomonas syringae]MCF5473368.1 DUF1534 domain-containing protein [Pseudomonas syringae]MCF5483383.1 DUF1534 domain-containing protein [Pseudomonas syringae]MCF5487335.1 DUF1534 domain-containing protein [Pseudomonas syringae]MCF5492487.1 DUF1534 domain-containing protein [Pseudomonas syringae]